VSNKDVSNWKISLPNLLVLMSMVVGVTTWSFQTFQSKEVAHREHAQFDARIQAAEGEIRNMHSTISDVAKDVSYIRGRLEPRVKGE
jgi:hypothetical protein